MTPRRRERLESLLHQVLAEMLLSGGVKDYRVDTNVLIRDVKVARDFSAAKVYVSSYQEERLAAAVQGLNHAAGFIRHQIAPKLHTRFIPTLTFYPDDSVKRGSELRLKMKSQLSHRHDPDEKL